MTCCDTEVFVLYRVSAFISCARLRVWCMRACASAYAERFARGKRLCDARRASGAPEKRSGPQENERQTSTFDKLRAMFTAVASSLFAFAPSACPPAGFRTLDTLNLTEYTRASWFIQQQQITGYQSLDDLFCVAATYNLEGKKVPLSSCEVHRHLRSCQAMRVLASHSCAAALLLPPPLRRSPPYTTTATWVR